MQVLRQVKRPIIVSSMQSAELWSKNDIRLGATIFVLSLIVFLLSPVHQILDSHYSMLLSENLIKHGSFELDPYFVPPLDRKLYPGTSAGDIPYSIERVNGHLYYYFPPGSSVLSAPLVAMLNLFGITTISEGNLYNLKGEMILQIAISALLMSVVAGLFYFTARIHLTWHLSFVVALTGAFGTPIWSTASRGLWSSTWQTFLMAAVVFILFLMQRKNLRYASLILATVLCWSYFVRPTGTIPLVVVTGYILLRKREQLFPFLGVCVFWFAMFLLYSKIHFDSLLPGYYLASRLSFDHFAEAFSGNLLSPSRGLLVFLPWLLIPVFLTLRTWTHGPSKDLQVLSLVIILIHIAVVSTFPHWWGGYCFGPRFSTELVPWFVLLTILSFRSYATAITKLSPGLLRLALLLVILSIAIHAVGALSKKSMAWNVQPVTVDEDPSRLWDWNDPQFLAFITR